MYDINNYPPEMKKKITLYKHFKKFFQSQKNRQPKATAGPSSEAYLDEEVKATNAAPD